MNTTKVTLIDIYNYHVADQSNKRYECDVGSIRFRKSSRYTILIYSININENEQGKGHFRNLIDYIMNDPLVNTLKILALYHIEYILYRQCFTNIGGDFVKSKLPLGREGITKDISNLTYQEYLVKLGIDINAD